MCSKKYNPPEMLPYSTFGLVVTAPGPRARAPRLPLGSEPGMTHHAAWCRRGFCTVWD